MYLWSSGSRSSSIDLCIIRSLNQIRSKCGMYCIALFQGGMRTYSNFQVRGYIFWLSSNRFGWRVQRCVYHKCNVENQRNFLESRRSLSSSHGARTCHAMYTHSVRRTVFFGRVHRHPTKEYSRGIVHRQVITSKQKARDKSIRRRCRSLNAAIP